MQERQLADLVNINDVNSFRHVDDGGSFFLGKKDLFRVPYNDRLAIDPNLEGPERSLLQGGFEVRQFHGLSICGSGQLSRLESLETKV